MDKLNINLHVPLQLWWPAVRCITKSIGIWSKEMHVEYCAIGFCTRHQRTVASPVEDHQGAKGVRT